MNLNMLVGPICVLFGIFVTLYVKDKARDAAKEEYADRIVASLATFKNELIEILDHKYKTGGECDLMMNAHDDRIDIHEKRLNVIDDRLNQLPCKGCNHNKEK